MKNKIFTVAFLVALLTTPFVASARYPSVSTVCGVVAGFDAAGLNVKNVDMSYKDRIGYHFGMMFGLDFPLVDIIPEVLYVNNKLKFNEGNTMNMNKLVSHSIEIPVLASVDLSDVFYVKAGPSFSVVNEAKLKTANGSTINIGRVTPSTGYVLGVGLSLYDLQLEVRYNGQLRSVNSTFVASGKIPTTYDIGSDSFSFSLGYKFRLYSRSRY